MEPDSGVTNIRNTSSAHWKRWLQPGSRCLVPFTSFSGYDTIDGKKVPVWFAADVSRPMMAFAGIRTNWTSVRKAKEGEVTADVFGFLTMEPNAEVGKVHPKAMPVILRTTDEFDAWLSADWATASKLQRPLPDGELQIVASGEKEDPASGNSANLPPSLQPSALRMRSSAKIVRERMHEVSLQLNESAWLNANSGLVIAAEVIGWRSWQ